MTATVGVSQIVSTFPEDVKKQIVDILKTGIVHKDNLDKDKISYYLSAVHMSKELKDVCEDLLIKGMRIGNCLDALELANEYGLLLLKKEAISVILENFEYIRESKAFLNLSESSLEILCNLSKISKSRNIFLALEAWLECDHGLRLKNYLKMLEIVQKQRNPPKQFECKRKYNTYHAMLMASSAKSKMSVVTAVFNCDGELVCHRKLFKSTDMKKRFSVACMQKDESDAPYVFISSGKRVFRYDPMLNKDEVCSSLNHFRNNSSLVAVNGYLYAIGGVHNGISVGEVEELDTSKQRQKWKVVTKCPVDIVLHSAPCVVHNNKVYIVAEQNDDYQSMVIVTFDPTCKSMVKIAEFPKKCTDCKTVVHGSDIYIASSEGYLVKFDTNTNIFTSCADMPNQCRHFGIYIEGNIIHTVCGTSNDNSAEQFEKDEYDLETDSWKRTKHLPCNLPIYGNCDIKVPSYTNVIPFYDTKYRELKH